MQLFWQGILQAARGIRTDLFRALLTLLAVALGAAALVAMMGVIESMIAGMQAYNHARGGLNKITVVSQTAPASQRSLQHASPGRTMRDVDALRRNARLVRDISPEVAISWQPLVINHRDGWGMVHGVLPAFARVYFLSVKEGRFLTEMDNDRVAPVCVLGEGIARWHFNPGETVLGSKIRIAGQLFTIVGTLGHEHLRQGTHNSLWQRNWSIWIPISTAQKLFTGSPKIDQLDMCVTDLATLPAAMAEVDNILRPVHRGVQDYRVENQLETMLDFGRRQQRLRLTLGCAAAISLLVGGIGIMGVTLAGVTERVREIGVRRALGARPGDIFAQFLLEATTLGIVGGLAGAAMGAGFVSLFANLLPEQAPVLVPSSLGLGAVASTITGALAGLYPAARAASLDPIEALRYE